MDNGVEVWNYLSDIVGAFDRVDRDILVGYFPQSGISHSMLRLLFTYLAPRAALVVVQGSKLDTFIIEDDVLQRTVFGLLLWNAFFKKKSTIHSGAHISPSEIC